jgi:hypothetical protein
LPTPGVTLAVAMNVDRILDTFNQHRVRYLLIGGMNFLLRHEPTLTYDVDIWIEDNEDNRGRCESALTDLQAEWGPTDDTWQRVAEFDSNWLEAKAVFCLMSPYGAIDIFRSVRGLDDWQLCWDRAVDESTQAGISFRGLSDDDMLRCQLALAEGERKQSRIRALETAIQNRGDRHDRRQTP